MDKKYICTFCNKEFSNKSNLSKHNHSTKSCKHPDKHFFSCEFCKKELTSKNMLTYHKNICKNKESYKNVTLETKIRAIEEQSKEEKLNIERLKIERLKEERLKEEQLKEELLKEERLKVERLKEERLKVELLKEELLKEERLKEERLKEENKLYKYDIGDTIYIESNKECYINIENLCKTNQKSLNEWHKLDETKIFLTALSKDVNIPTHSLITSDQTQITWVHPYIAINIAQWISPETGVKISSWIHEIMLYNSKLKEYKQLCLENTEQKLKIDCLTKKYVKLQSRVKYTDKNVIYILTTPSHKKEGKYILGKATNLTNRLSVYNKTDDYEVVYYQSCLDEETMALAEKCVFLKLKNYRQQANRERFILPSDKTIDVFINIIKDAIEFLK
jgi:hypothetical protein